MPKKGGKRRKTRTHEKPIPEGAAVQTEDSLAPRSIVAKAGKVDPFVTELIMEMRKVMEPYTARNLRERSFNKMKDFVSVASQLGVSHLLFFSQTDSNIILRIIKDPEGPTLHFRIQHFYLPRQIKAMQKRPFESTSVYLTPPVVVLNNFGQAEENHMKLMKLTFQHMFPTINVKTVQLSQVRRVVLFHYHKESDTVEMRHYAIRANSVGISKSVKRIVQAKIPNLGRLKDIADYLEGGDYGASDSEVEDDSSKVTLPERYAGRGNVKSQVSALKLMEIGPRLSLELYKVQQGVNEGDILYHKFVHKTAEEAAAIKQRVEKERLLKEMRKKQQQDNVDKKKKEKEEKQQRKKQRKEEKAQDGPKKDEDSEEEEEEESDDDEGDGEVDEDDEVEFEEDEGEGEYDQDDEEEGEGDEEEEEGDDEEEEEEEEEGN